MKVQKQWKNKSGIYKIIFKNRHYIGSSVDLYMRIAQHISHLRANKHHSKFMQRVYNKYGEKNFKIEVLEYCENNIKILREKELYYMNNNNSVFNSTTPVYYVHSEEMKKQISRTLKRKYKNKEIVNPRLNKGNMIYLYDFNGNLIMYDLVKNITEYLNISNRSVVNNAIREKRPLVKGYIVSKTTTYYKELINYIIKRKGSCIPLYKLYKNGQIELCSNSSREYMVEKTFLNKDFIYYSKINKCFYTFIGLLDKCRLREEIPKIITAELSKKGENPNLN